MVDTRAALAAGASLVHADVPGNVVLEGRVKILEFDAVWAGAYKVVKLEARSRRQNATPMEARAGHAAYEPVTGRITLTCTTQMPHLTRTAIADIIGMPESDLRVIAPDVGGGFGQKMSLAPEYVLLVWLARRLKTLGRLDRGPAREPDRRLSQPRTDHRAASRLRQEREIAGAEGRHYRQCRRLFLFPDHLRSRAADGHGGTARPLRRAAIPVPGRAASPPTPAPMAPYRGVSRPVITFALERLMDKAAAAFEIDPIDIRRRNLIDKFPYTSATGLVFDEASYKQTLEMAVKAINVPAFRERQKQARAQGRHLGIGFATFSERTGYGSPAFAARGMEITPGWESVDCLRRSVRLC